MKIEEESCPSSPFHDSDGECVSMSNLDNARSELKSKTYQ